jgi:hypothetical protein
LNERGKLQKQLVNNICIYELPIIFSNWKVFLYCYEDWVNCKILILILYSLLITNKKLTLW